jgi:hypothetical protein
MSTYDRSLTVFRADVTPQYGRFGLEANPGNVAALTTRWVIGLTALQPSRHAALFGCPALDEALHDP